MLRALAPHEVRTDDLHGTCRGAHDDRFVDEEADPEPIERASHDGARL